MAGGDHKYRKKIRVCKGKASGTVIFFYILRKLFQKWAFAPKESIVSSLLKSCLATLAAVFFLLSCFEENDWRPLNSFAPLASDQVLASAVAGKWTIEDEVSPYEFYEFIPLTGSLSGTYIITERNNKQQTTNNKQQTTNNKQQTTNNKQQTTNNKQHS
jgi:hypothetical protein